jgi:hypothetical protein
MPATRWASTSRTSRIRRNEHATVLDSSPPGFAVCSYGNFEVAVKKMIDLYSFHEV